MPEYLSPGVYVEEIEIGPKSIEGVSTSTAGIVGPTERGPISPTFISSFSEYESVFGGYLEDSFMSYAVDGFFQNGGKRCFVSRIIGKNAEISGLKTAESNGLIITANGHGQWGNRICIKISDASLIDMDSSLFKIEVKYFPKIVPPNIDDSTDAVEEIFDNLSPNPKSSDHCVSVVNGSSKLIKIITTGSKRPRDVEWSRLEKGSDNGTTTRPARKGSSPRGKTVDADTDNDSSEPTPEPASTVFSDWDITSEDFRGHEIEIKDPKTDAKSSVVRTGLRGFENIDDISIVVAPDETNFDGIRDAVVNHCEKMKDRFAVLQVSREDSINIDKFSLDRDSKYAAIYMPMINVHDPTTNSERMIPPGGHIAGIYARSDVSRGVHKAPANEQVNGVLSLQVQINKEKQDILNPRGINVIRSFPGRGQVVWGARTTSIDPDWKYVNVRRLFLYLEKSIERSTQWVVFEPNNERLWSRVKATISGFLTEVWKSGAIMGTNPDEAFFVKCDRTTMTQNDIDNGRLIVLIGVAPTKPAEFVIFRLAQTKNGSATEEM